MRTRQSWILAVALALGGSVLPSSLTTADDLAPSSIWMQYFDAGQPLQAGHVITLTASIQVAVDGWADGATVSFDEVDGRAPSCVTGLDPEQQLLCAIASIPAGTYHYRATYSGNATVAGSVSDPYELTIAPNTLEVSGVGVNYPTFYPTKDSYKDTLKISGHRTEAASVTIKIYSPAGKLLKTKTLPSAAGAYAYSWSGRSSSGAIYAAGKYKVTQTLKDAGGLSKTWTSYSHVSKKKLVSKTKYITKRGSSVSVKGDLGSGSITISTSGGYTKLKGVYPSGWVGIGYGFTLPSAAVYSSMSFQVYNKGYLGAPLNQIALQNFHVCAYSATADWDMSCFDHFNAVGSGAGAKFWDKASGNVTTNRSGTRVRGIVSVNNGTLYVYSVRLKVVYKVLQ
jgi:FlgD Ig-like domain